jgi:hypothetical protein
MLPSAAMLKYNRNTALFNVPASLTAEEDAEEDTTAKVLLQHNLTALPAFRRESIMYDSAVYFRNGAAVVAANCATCTPWY